MSAEAWRRTGADLAPLPFAWQAWHFRELRLDLRGRCHTFFSICIDVSAEAWRRTGADLAPLPFAWQGWHFRELRLDLRGRCGTFSTCIDVCGSLATNRC